MVNRGDGQHEHQARAKQKGHVVSDCAEKKKAAERRKADCPKRVVRTLPITRLATGSHGGLGSLTVAFEA